MPLHVWLPRAHPIAPAPVSALMSGVMIKVAIYALVRVLVDWLGVLPVWFGVLVLALGAFSAVGGVVYALFQHELKRLLAFHSIENVGIIVLGLGACLVLRARGAERGRRSRSRPRCCTRSTTRSSRRCCSSAAGSFERAVGSLELRPARRAAPPHAVDRRRVPRRRAGDRRPAAAERLRVRVADPAGAAARPGVRRSRRRDRRRDRAGRARGDRGARGLLLRQGQRARAARAADGEADASAREAPLPMRSAVAFLALACVVLGLVPGLLFGVLAGLAPWASDAPTTPGCGCPAPARCRRRDRDRARRPRGLVRPPRGAGAPHRRRAGPAGRTRPRARLDERRLHQAAAARARAAPAPEREIAVWSTAGSFRASPTAAGFRT